MLQIFHCLLLSTTLLHADWIFTRQDVNVDFKGVSQTNILSIKVKPDRIRIDYGDRITGLYSLQEGRLMWLVHPAKSYIPGSQHWDLQNRVLARQNNLSQPTPPGHSSTINGQFAREYTLTNSATTQRLWVSTNNTAFSSFKNFLRTPNPLLLPMPRFFEFDGPVIKAEAAVFVTPDLPGGTSPPIPLPTSPFTNIVTSVLLSFAETNINDAEFKMPQDYVPGPLREVSFPPEPLLLVLQQGSSNIGTAQVPGGFTPLTGSTTSPPIVK
jgi:hypothetical protein